MAPSARPAHAEVKTLTAGAAGDARPEVFLLRRDGATLTRED